MNKDLIKRYISSVEIDSFPSNVQRVLEHAAKLWAETNEVILLETKEKLRKEIADKQEQLSKLDADIAVIAVEK